MNNPNLVEGFNIRINDFKHTITITKEFKKKIAIYGSDERNALQQAMRDCPNYRVVVNTTPKRKFEDRITMKDILYYVENHSGKDSPEMKQLEELRGKSVKDAESVFDFEESASFKDIKEWFFATYSELAEKTEKRQAQIAKIVADAKENNKKEIEAATDAASTQN